LKKENISLNKVWYVRQYAQLLVSSLKFPAIFYTIPKQIFHHMRVSVKIDLKYIATSNDVESSVPRCRESAINALKLHARDITGVLRQ